MGNRIFVFGSNLAGIHGAGSAKYAWRTYGAKSGVGVGRTGDAYAIPTKDKRLNVLPLNTIRGYVEMFLAYARENPHLEFDVVKIGCGFANYTDAEIAPMFKERTRNVHLHPDWEALTFE